MTRPPARPSERRARGLSVEDRAAAHLEEKGYTILARNHACPAGEVDIVASRDEVLAFVEVRSRVDDGFGSPAETVGYRKRRRIIAAATDWSVRAGVWATARIRFDIVAVLDRGDELELEHIEAAFDGDGRP